MRAILVFLSGLVLMQAQDITSAAAPPSIRVHGEGTVSAEPDQAQLDISVENQAATAKAAMDENATKTNAVIEQLRSLVPRNDIKTVNLSVNPNYNYPKDGSAPKITGYTANNTVRLMVNDLSQLSKAIDGATNSGANGISRLSFALKNEEAVRAKAIADAARQAESAAEALSGALKLKLGRLLRAEEGQPAIISPTPPMAFARAEKAVATPVSPGMIEVRADVNLTYEISGESK
jgi:uncharacterized protein YggE